VLLALAPLGLNHRLVSTPFPDTDRIRRLADRHLRPFLLINRQTIRPKAVGGDRCCSHTANRRQTGSVPRLWRRRWRTSSNEL